MTGLGNRFKTKTCLDSWLEMTLSVGLSNRQIRCLKVGVTEDSLSLSSPAKGVNPQKSRSSEPTDDLLILSSHAKGVNPQKTRKRKRSLESSSEPVKKVTKVDASKTWQDKWLVDFKWLK